MDQNRLSLILEDLRNRLEGNEQIADIICDNAIETLTDYGIDPSSEEGFDALHEIVGRTSLITLN